MRPEFSEFTYGFSIVYELSLALDCRVAPVFPSLKREGSPGGGYDVQMDKGAIPLFLQFKLTDQLKTRNAKEVKISPDLLTPPYRRFAITSSIVSNQHELLIGLNHQYDDVFYCAPNFGTNEELNQMWENGSSVNGSVYVKPIDIGPITDGERHAICFDNDSLRQDQCYLFSSPTNLPIHSYRMFSQGILEKLTETTKPLKEQIPMWLEKLDIAREEANFLHKERVEAIKRLRDKEESERLSSAELFEITEFSALDERVAYRFTDDLVDLASYTPVPSYNPATREYDRDLDPNRELLRQFGQRASAEFGVQPFILQL